MRILHAHRIAVIGGSERHLLTLLPALAERGHEVVFAGLDVAGDGGAPFYAELARIGIDAVHVPSRNDLSPRTSAGLIRALRRVRPDLLHTHLVHADAHGALAATVTRTRLVSTKHNDDRFRAGRFRHVERGLGRAEDRIICITESVARFNREVVGLPAEKLTVVRYGLDAPPVAWGNEGDAAVPADARLLLAVSRLVEQKGIDVAVRALARIREDEPRAVLAVLGEGPERTALTSLAASLGLADAVLLPGHVGDVAAWLARAELLVHPARWEGFGLVLLEAMHAGLPIVASDTSAIPEVVADGVTGVLVRPDDPEALADAVSGLLGDPARAAELGAAGRDRARSLFSVAAMTEATIRVYEDVLA